MQDRPSAAEILEIVAETLRETVVPATEPQARHQARVAANLCAILQRELADSDGADQNGQVANLGRRADELRSCADPDDDATIDALADEVAAKLSINKPGYTSHDHLTEADVVR